MVGKPWCWNPVAYNRNMNLTKKLETNGQKKKCMPHIVGHDVVCQILVAIYSYLWWDYGTGIVQLLTFQNDIER